MRSTLSIVLVTGLLAGATAAFADYGSPPPAPKQEQPSGTSAEPASPDSPRAEAQRSFADAYDDVVKAGKDMDKGRKDSADKRYKRALERARHAVELDSTYHEAWNLVGFTSRKLGDYKSSFAAYDKALALKPDFALALEYYGEGLLETGDLAGAQKMFARLKATGDKDLTAELDQSIVAYVAKHPANDAAPASASAPAAADTSSTPSSH